MSGYTHIAKIGLQIAFFCTLILLPCLGNGIVSAQSDTAEKQMEALKSRMETTKPASPALVREYDRLYKIISDCSPTGQIIKTFRADDPLAPQANLCINGALAIADPDFNRPLASSTGTGIGNGTVGNCTLSGTATAANHDVYSFNLTGCAAFPTEVTATLCGPAGCQHVGNVDTMLILYRNVAAGDPLTANGGLPSVFNPASPCTNARGGSDDLGTTSGTPNNPGGATCNQVVGADCVAPCTSPSNGGGLSGFRRQLGNGRFTMVIAGFGNTTVGSYNLYVDAPAAGCVVALAPSAANGGITGRVLTANGRGLGMTTITVSGGTLAAPVTALSNPFGYYTVSGLEAGQSYSVSVSTKGHGFASPTQIVTVQDDLANVDFVSFD